MGKKKKPAMCCNGCDAPVCPPSEVLCKVCLDALDKKIHSLVVGALDPKGG